MYCRIINSHKFANIKKSLVKFRLHNQSISSHKEKLQKKNSLFIQEQFYKNNFGNVFLQIALSCLLIYLCLIMKKIIQNVRDLKKFLKICLGFLLI